MKYFCPIVIKNSNLRSFHVSSGIKVRRMTTKEKGSFFGLKKADFGFTKDFLLGFIGFNSLFPTDGKNQKVRCPYSSLMHRGHFDGVSDILASNYLVEATILDNGRMEFVDNVNLMFKLLQPTSTGIYLEFREGETDVGFHYNQAIHGPCDYLMIDRRGIKRLQIIYQLLEKNKNERFRLCCSLYSRALLGDKSAFDVRFLLLTMALESLYLSNNQELSFKLRLYVSRTLESKLFKRKFLYDQIKIIYEIRSEVVHNGHSKKLSLEVFYMLTEIVRGSLTAFLYRPEIFDDLEMACLN